MNLDQIIMDQGNNNNEVLMGTTEDIWMWNGCRLYLKIIVNFLRCGKMLSYDSWKTLTEETHPWSTPCLLSLEALALL
jgi:hypothetical protein